MNVDLPKKLKNLQLFNNKITCLSINCSTNLGYTFLHEEKVEKLIKNCR